MVFHNPFLEYELCKSKCGFGVVDTGNRDDAKSLLLKQRNQVEITRPWRLDPLLPEYGLLGAY